MMPDFRDKSLVCCECREKFIFPAEAQVAFLERGLPLKPKLCPKCYTAYCKLLRTLRDNHWSESRRQQGGLP